MNILITGSSVLSVLIFVPSSALKVTIFIFMIGMTANISPNPLFVISLKAIPDPEELDRFDAVVHPVGKVHDVEGSASSNEYKILNYSSVLSFAKNCSEANVKKFIFFSTIKTSELETNNNPANIYASTKRQGEIALMRSF